ncbi:monovalent cation/H+ antiporter subunit D [Ectothiorhodospiraceae bacterium WFHF3C12]|nr:monovalent cation/H+ antiporter subunit D [Ectothiorhodospiraceae bacterium WFHF3C12]
MTHLPVLPILIPALAGFALLLLQRASLPLQRGVSLIAAVLGLVVAVWAVTSAVETGPLVYELGSWPAPFGIVLVLDQLSALMVLLTAILSVTALTAASLRGDAAGRVFHALFQFQLMGIQGAFLTGDIFNLFVFFEILLIASYGLLLHGQGAPRMRAGIKYVVVNLTGSALFLVAVALLYGATGTLNMADIALALENLDPADRGLVQASALLFLVVFGTKAALLPVMFWLPDAYSAAPAPVASLFAIMTKIGVYAILRVYTLCFAPLGDDAGAFIAPWLLGAALLTLAVGMIGVLASRRLRQLVAYMTIASVGTMLIPVAMFTQQGVAAALYYLVHSTLTVAALFLLAEPISRGRHGSDDHLEPGPALASGNTLGLWFMALAVAAAGVPPLSGFLGKAMILRESAGHDMAAWIWAVILVTSLLAVVSFSRAGSVLFWKVDQNTAPGARVTGSELAPVATLGGLIVALTVFAAPVQDYTRSTAAALIAPQSYIDAVVDYGVEGRADAIHQSETPTGH